MCTSLVILHQFLLPFSFSPCGSELRKEIRAEQLHYEGTLRWPLSPHAVRSGFDTDEDEEEEAFPEPEVGAEISDVGAGTELPEGLPAEDAAPEASSSEDQATSEASTARRKKKASAPRMRYSLFHFDFPRRMKRVIRPSPPEKPVDYSPIKHVHSPSWGKLATSHYDAHLLATVTVIGTACFWDRSDVQVHT